MINIVDVYKDQNGNLYECAFTQTCSSTWKVVKAVKHKDGTLVEYNDNFLFSLKRKSDDFNTGNQTSIEKLPENFDNLEIGNKKAKVIVESINTELITAENLISDSSKYD